MQKTLEEVFGSGNTVVLTLPYRQQIDPDQATFGDFTVFFAGATNDLRNAFVSHPDYKLRVDESPTPNSPNGFQQLNRLISTEQKPDPGWLHFGVATVLPPKGALRTPTDDWPFLYLRNPMIPTLSLRGALIMGALGLLLIFLFVRQLKENKQDKRALSARFFFLGAGFMLIETKAVVMMALLFGGTWIVNSVVFFALLVMILIANAWSIRFNPDRLWPYYVGLLITLTLNAIVPLDFFLGMSRIIQITGSCLLVLAPIFFSGIIFASSFKKTASPDRAFGINVAGAMVGGLAEYTSMLLGFQYLAVVAIVFYSLSAISKPRPD